MTFTLLSFRTLAAFVGAFGILSAAFGAHGLEKVAAPGGVRLWAIGAAIHLATAPILFVAGNLASQNQALRASPILLTLGLVLFAGSLYAMALGAPRFLGAITPLGGLALTAGWLLLAFR